MLATVASQKTVSNKNLHEEQSNKTFGLRFGFGLSSSYELGLPGEKYFNGNSLKYEKWT